MDLTCVQCVVGRIKSRGRWALLDRSGTMARAMFADDTRDLETQSSEDPDMNDKGQE